MKQFLKKRWVVPVGALVLVLAIGSAAFAATGTNSDSTSTSGTDTAVSSGQNDATQTGQKGGQRSDETLLTGATQTQAEAAAQKAVADATIVRAETDADGNAKYEVHMTKADGTGVTVYLDDNFNVVKTEEGQAGGRGHHGDRDSYSDDSSAPSSNSASTTTS